MINQDWLATEDGGWQTCVAQITESRNQYRLYRFLTNVEDIVEAYSQDWVRLEKIRPLVRQLLNDSAWLQFAAQPPDPTVGWSVNLLYEEPQFPLTVQMVAWLPGQQSPIHNHASWGVVALLSGQEKNRFWRRSPNAEHPDRLESTGELVLEPGDLISFLPDAIHAVEALGNEPTVSFNIYGAPNYQDRWKFDPQTHTTQAF
ncbi:MAG: cupin [Thermosynechococcaceae cyanobacterium]